MSIFPPRALATRFGSFVTLVALGLSAAPSAWGAALFWAHYPPACQAPAGALSCGSRGAFAFSSTPLPALKTCGAVTYGAETPRLLIGPGAMLAAEGQFPCQAGECFGTQGDSENWVAVVDWNQPHGWTVGATVLAVGGETVSARLFALDEPRSGLLATLPVNDAHVIDQLCQVVEEAEKAASAPRLVNLSWGRRHQALSCPPGSAANLACHVQRLVEHLAGALEIPVVAAAGNHASLQFPASLPGVLAVGSVDLGTFRANGEAIASPETAAGVDALFPAAGLILATPNGAKWPVPAGSSYSAAFASGWLAAYAQIYPAWRDLLSWTGPLVFTRANSHFWLEVGGLSAPGSELPQVATYALVALGDQPAACWEARSLTPTSSMTVFLTEEEIMPLPSLETVQSSSNRPSPDSMPCVPCHDHPGGGLVPLASNQRLILDLDRSTPLAEDLELVELRVLVGNAWQKLQTANPAALAALESAAIDLLVIEDWVEMNDDVPISLVWVVRDLPSGQLAQFSTPVIRHHH